MACFLLVGRQWAADELIMIREPTPIMVGLKLVRADRAIPRLGWLVLLIIVIGALFGWRGANLVSVLGRRRSWAWSCGPQSMAIRLVLVVV